MKIFISWSGSTSQKAAQILHGWLPTVLQNAKPYMSAENINKGERWSVDIAKQLEDSDFGIICVTPENQTAPWVLFEAGALSKSLESGKVSPLLFDVSHADLTGSPLIQFQSTSFRKDEVEKLLISINEASSEPERLSLEVLHRSYERAWNELEQEISAINFTGSLNGNPSHDQPSLNKLDSAIDEILDIARTQLKIIKDPEQLLPQKYLAYALGEEARLRPRIPNALIDDLGAVAEELAAIIVIPDHHKKLQHIQERIRLAVTYLRKERIRGGVSQLNIRDRMDSFVRVKSALTDVDDEPS